MDLVGAEILDAPQQVAQLARVAAEPCALLGGLALGRLEPVHVATQVLGQLLPGAVAHIVRAWAERDPVATGEWLRRQPEGVVNDPARGVFAGLIGESDPKTALAWANTISDARIRRDAFEEIAFHWTGQDAAAAQRFLKEADWPADRITELRGILAEMPAAN